MSENPIAPNSSPSNPTPTSPATASDSVGSGPNQVIFESQPVEQPVAPPVEAPAEQHPYRVSKLENGQIEVSLDTGFRVQGDPDTVINELTKSVYNGSRTIAELRGKGPFAPQPVEQATIEPGQLDPTAVALADLAAQGLGFKDRNALLEQFSLLPQLQQSYQEQQLNNVAAQFLAQTPDFPNSPANADRLDATIAELGLDYSPKAIQVAHHYLKSTGQYERVATQATPQSSPMPKAPNGYMPNESGYSEQDLWNMPMDQFEKVMRGGR